MIALFLAVGCGGSGGSSPSDPIPCPTGNCGNEAFRRAVPTRDLVQIDFRRGRSRRPADSTPRSLGPRRIAELEAIAPAHDALAEHVDEINGTIEAIFDGIEELGSVEPEIMEDTLHRWRRADPDHDGYDEILTVESDNEVDFVLSYAAGPAGFEPSPEDTMMTGEWHVADEAADFALTVDWDVAGQVFEDVGVTGTLAIRTQPYEGEGREIWYDFAEFGEVGGELENSITTYWDLGDGVGALEYLDELHDSDATLFANWDVDGGRLDYHVQFSHPEYGPLDEISSDCWGGGGAETFYGWALFDAYDQAYVVIDGDEADCDFGPVQGHPDPGSDFDDLPGEGEWDDLASNAVPFCEEDPYAPDCISFCDLFPEGC